MTSEKTAGSIVLDTAASATQSFAPLSSICETVCGLHFYADDMTRQVEAHHYCSHVSEDFRQCVIYDAPTPDAKLIGIEYIVSEKVFKTFSEEEKRYWHSHHYEVKSGTLIAPFPSAVPKAVADFAEHKAMEKLVGTYGKTWHLWEVDAGHPYPFGPPRLMMGLTEDVQVDQALLADRDKRFSVSSEEKRKLREDIPMPHVDPKANAWQKGGAWQAKMDDCEVKGYTAR